MRPEHTPDDDGICTVCGAKPTTFAKLPRAGPLEMPKRTGLDDRPLLPPAHPGKGGSRKPSAAHRAAFAGARSFAEPKPPEDIATIPDPVAATIAQLELERDELDVTIATLKRIHARKVSA